MRSVSPKKPGRRDADDRERVAFDDERRPTTRWIAAVDRSATTWWLSTTTGGDAGVSSSAVKTRPPKALTPKRREVVAGDVFRPERARGDVHAVPADAERATPPAWNAVTCSNSGASRFEPFEERVREHAPAILRSALDAAVVAVADAVEARRVGDRQRAQHDRVDEREDRGRAADAERERQDGRGREDGRETELTDRVTDGADRVVHADRLDGIDPPSVDAVPRFLSESRSV